MTVDAGHLPTAVRVPSLKALRIADAAAIAGLSLLFVAVVLLTWRKWGNPEIDAGAELTAADLTAHGSVPYRDVRYFYGPLGLYSLAGTFRVFGTSFGVAFAFGLAQAAAILVAFYVLARHWLRPAAAGLASAVLLAIGFSGTAFNFVLPHTNSATMGCLFTILLLLALTRGRLWAAGVAAGCVGLTRPEFAAVGLAIVAAYVVGTGRDQNVRAAGRAALKIALPAVAIPLVVLGSFAVVVGADRLLTENLWPVDFIRVAGFRSQEHWMPFSTASVVGLIGRGVVYAAALAGAIAVAIRLRRRAGLVSVVAPGAAAIGGLLLLDGLARVTGWAPEQRFAIEQETRHLVLGMSWLPCLAAAVAAWAAFRFIRRRPAPFSNSWAVDLALVAAASAFGLRAYNAFTAEGSYAPYYAAPLVLLAGLLHERVGDRWPEARSVALGALGAVAAGLLLYALVGLYADQTTAVHTARGTYVADREAAPAIQQAVDLVRAASEPTEPVLFAPSDGGLYFMTNRRPVLSDLMLLPGLLDSAADERAAIAALERNNVPLVVVGVRDFSPYGFSTFGQGYDRILGSWLSRAAIREVRVGSFDSPAAGTYPSRGFRVLALRPAAAERLAARE